MAQSYTSLTYHIVFGTKNCIPFIHPEVAPPLHSYLAGIIGNLGGQPLSIGGVADHVHVLTCLSQERAVKDVVRDLKANSSRWVHTHFHDMSHFEWQRGYAAFTVSIKGVPQVKAYIGNQAAHHRDVPFRQEFAEFLRTHSIQFDERYIG